MSTDIRVQLADALKDHEDLSSPTRLDSLATVHRLRPIVARMDREAGMSGRFAHRVQRAAAKKAETEQTLADKAKHPRAGWTTMGTRDVYRVTVIEPGVTGKSRPTYVSPLTGEVESRRLPNIRLSDEELLAEPQVERISVDRPSLHRESGSLILRAQAAIDSGRKNGLGELRLECRDMALRIRQSNPNASALLEKMERALRVAQYELSQYS